jgi:ribosomal-protein-alanine N-acetyltransferase
MFQIEKAVVTEIDQIMAVEHDCFEIGIIEDQQVFLERIQTFPEGFFVVKNLKDQQIIAYISSEIWHEKPIYTTNDFKLGHSIKSSHHLNGSELYIASMGVLKSERGKGLGDLLFKELLSTLKKSYPHLSSAVLIVSADWQNAQKIYQKNGFKEIGRLENFFNPSSNLSFDAIIMRKTLTHFPYQTP